MKLFKIISKILQIGLLLTFLLPFFPSGCQDSPVMQSDSSEIEVPAPHIDTTAVDTSQLKTSNAKNDTLVNNYQKSITNDSTSQLNKTRHNKRVSEKLIEKFTFLECILRPQHKYSGIGYIIDSLPGLILYFGLVITFFLWIIALILKFRGKSLFHVLNIIGIVFMLGTNPIFLAGFEEIKLWGYWLCFWWATAMIIFDLYWALKLKNRKSITI